MKAELNIDTQELESRITQKVINALKPLLASGKAEDDNIYTVKTLAKRLVVSEKWIYERIQFKEIPFYKIGGHVRFCKREIDHWLNSCKTPAINPLSAALKAVK
ncbi:MAG: helix-turn-helix domain-containing protein [Deltaproteobacteria bacterium]|nr:helix-turn-helix domain-containing protein [Deltaproteobacteria bacterium]